MEMTAADKKIISSILAKTDKDPEIGSLKTISFPELYKYLGKEEISLIKNFLKINPHAYGFKGKFLGMAGVPRNLVVIKNQTYTFRRKQKTIGEQCLPKSVYEAYGKLNQALRRETGRTLLISFGYRSPAYQVITFFYYLKFYGFNFKKTAKRVAFPGYSEHGAPRWPAIDFVTMKGMPSDKNPLDFVSTEEYRWLLKNAHRFGFYLSYPKNNKDGIMYEPWHWRFEK